MSRQEFIISSVKTAEDLKEVIALLKLYAASLDIDLTFQDFATEMASMPGKYSPPTGALLLARKGPGGDGESIGCVGLRSLGEGVCEMKRLYVSSSGRGQGIGRSLAEAIIMEAKRLGYRSMRLDTLPSMSAARKLYQMLGFVEVERYYDTPLEGTVFLELALGG